MGTTYNVSTVFNSPKESDTLAVIKKGIHSALERVDSSMSTYKGDSEVSQFNALAVGESFSMGADFSSVYHIAAEVSVLTRGYFDITVGPLVALWGFGVNGKVNQVIPQQSAIDAVLRKVGMNKVSIDSNKLVKLEEVEIDLSAIAKGYGADVVGRYLLDAGITNYMVEVGGEVVVNGVNRRGSNWVLGIERPDKNQRSVYTAVGISGLGMATSGDYRNFRTVEGKNYAHTIDPVRGVPSKSSLASVTVIASNCAKADALATALMAMGELEAIKFANEHRLSAFFIVRHENKFESRSTPFFEKYIL